MRMIVWLLIALAALGFVLAVLSVLTPLNIMGVTAESYSRACGNLALIAIALILTHKKESD